MRPSRHARSAARPTNFTVMRWANWPPYRIGSPPIEMSLTAPNLSGTSKDRALDQPRFAALNPEPFRVDTAIRRLAVPNDQRLARKQSHPHRRLSRCSRCRDARRCRSLGAGIGRNDLPRSWFEMD